MVAATAFALAVCAGGAASAAPVPNAWVTAGLGPASTNGFIGDVAVGRAGHAYMAVNDQLATSANVEPPSTAQYTRNSALKWTANA